MCLGKGGCGCKKQCYKNFTEDQIDDARRSMMALTSVELDIFNGGSALSWYQQELYQDQIVDARRSMMALTSVEFDIFNGWSALSWYQLE